MLGHSSGCGVVVGLVVACGIGVCGAQPQGGGGQLPAPVFDPVLLFEVDAVNPYGLAAVDFLDANGTPGQDGYPEVAVSGTGVDLFDQTVTVCESSPGAHYVRIYHNKGATVRWDGTDGPDPDNDPDDPLQALVEVQALDLQAADDTMWAMEIAFADLTGAAGPDLVVVGMDPDVPAGFVLVYENLGNGLFSQLPVVKLEPSVPLRGVTLADLDLDGKIDIAASAASAAEHWFCSPAEQDIVLVFRNETDEFGMAFSQGSPVDLGTPFDAAPGDLAIADFTALMPGQPLLDLATPNPNNDAITAITNLGGMSFNADAVSPPSGCEWQFISAVGERFGADLTWDLAAVHTDDVSDWRVYAEVLHGDGLGSFQSDCNNPPGYQLDIQGQSAPELHAHGIDAGSIDNGPYPDVAVATWRIPAQGGPPNGNSNVAVLLGKGDGTMQGYSAQQAYLFETDGVECANVLVVDLDADGFDDMIAANHWYDTQSERDFISVFINSLEVTGIGP